MLKMDDFYSAQKREMIYDALLMASSLLLFKFKHKINIKLSRTG